ncbi:MAG: tRNA 2-thiouridine(34) synthase MnmA [Candidatus Marinimicrobia bacterium]|nr:tRNA 2-thiouridine(34) synthase MnmA [Candidatus Neomarinimicrobiota bacterium]|tara:strand:- start:4723 stop:5805 length:1083 start_codon:yes stop_codon:yes gene_type:complete
MKKKVLVAMSGGVDSSVTLLRIIEMGYEAIGVTMKLWEYSDVGGAENLQENNCCAVSSINKAKMVCERMGVPHYTIDFTESFKKNVVDNFVDEYVQGRTPNPCVRCNSFIKWDTFIEQAEILGAEYIATGHYAKIEEKDGTYYIKQGDDTKKDQSYVLWGIPKETLAKTILPLGDLTKEQVRDIAREHKLETADEPESMEICFIADNNYKRFIKEYAPDKTASIKQGQTLNEDGEQIGENDGYINYTIGQRRGIGVSNEKPLYVKEIDSDTNTITVGEKNSLFKDTCKVKGLNWLINEPEFPYNILCQIRYNGSRAEAVIHKQQDDFTVNFSTPQLAITPGQSIVFYLEDTLIGGGIIEL